MDATANPKAGQLTIVGSGIASINHMTLQAVACIETADVVCYVVADGATEAFIRKKNENCIDLYPLYSETKERTDTYIQMAEFMLNHVRAGKNVVGVFYGHPGVFVCPTHRAIYIARNEGYRAVMLPGLSAEDCLYADLGIDPSTVGCITYEATDMLVYNRPLNSSSHLVLYQVGIVGKADFKFAYDPKENHHFGKLIDRLELEYGPDHTVVHYIAPIFPTEEPVMERFTIGQLKLKENSDKIATISTFYLPPKAPSAKVSLNREFLRSLNIADSRDPMTPFPWNPTAAPYGEREKKVILELESHVPPPGYRPLKKNSGLAQALEKLSLDTRALAAWKTDRKAYADSVSGLTDDERDALASGKHAQLSGALKEGGVPMNHAQLTFFFIISNL
ncbi:tetrapyrrole methylase [Coprinopsis marcescibilis]|uniref:Methyltransferase/ribosomally synthesized type I borosin cyclic peptide precursor cmaMA n=1 Tax=Coprinopsis marcescibilis TaxID=230819 RepID=CMAMA_COPMA|nr:RecName: Full=Methyltransferase/ribosomally synthesized type I borosin cyclic peptide precursor cmaMA; AltName: Full=Type I borosin cyclic peptide biosynthesis cluster protein MA; Contains: RecName: Full=N-methyltranferase cmaM; Contains: RecName: Full=Ribosomally synthesized type I borosin core peptide; Flags: Precursor [Coprinopsis marcescibilis]TFK23735.1 tetrapyrrole methylase [Coprinopsis marcescibilis]